MGASPDLSFSPRSPTMDRNNVLGTQRCGMFKKMFLYLVGLMVLGGIMGACRALPTPVPTATVPPSPTPTLTATPTPTATSSPTPTPTSTLTPSPTPTATSTPSPSPTLTPTVTPSPTFTPTPTFVAGRPTPSLTPVYWGHARGRRVHIGFDVEGDPRVLYAILDVLDEFHYCTTFFVSGYWAERFPKAVEAIAARCHEIGNHSWSHSDFRKLSEEEIGEELDRTEALIVKLTGQSTKPYFRPPYSYRNKTSIRVAYEHGYTHILWSVDSYDWRDREAEKVYHNIVDHVRPGAIVYMHTSYGFAPEVLRRALKALVDEGYTLSSLTDILVR